MDNRGVFWSLFLETGAVGLYLLYRNCSREVCDKMSNDENENDSIEAASERG